MDLSFKSFSRRWSLANAIINVIGLLMAWHFGLEWVWWTSVLPWFGYYVFCIPKLHVDLPLAIGYANMVTVVRLLLLLALVALHGYLLPEWLFGGLLLVVLLDGVDGWIARKYGQSSPVGELLDMETDAFMVLALSWIHYQNDLAGWWILIPGGMRYYVEILLHRFLATYEEPLPKRLRSTIAVVFFISLIGAFVLPENVGSLSLIVSSTLILTSFGMSVLLRLVSSLKSG